MSYSYRLFNSIAEVDRTAWERVCSEYGASIFMDLRFIAAVENGMKPSCRFWYVIVYDRDSRPAACACLTAMTIDLADFANPGLAWIIRRLPSMLSRLRRLKLLICGLPVSPGGEKSLVLASKDASPQILPLLDAVICDLATHTGMDAILYKEFGKNDLAWTQPLVDLGYQRIPSLPMHYFTPSFQSFERYHAALKTSYRQQINRSTRKLKGTGVELSILTDPEEILRAYTPEVHALYYQVLDRATFKPEILPHEFFRQLTLALKDEVELIVFSTESKIIAFGWCIHAGSTYHMFYAGLDYRFNKEFDLYFNLNYAALDRALRSRPSRIHFGQSGNAFKARIGCYSEPLYLFAKGLGPLMSRVIHYGAGLLTPRQPPVPQFDIFKSGFDPGAR